MDDTASAIREAFVSDEVPDCSGRHPGNLADAIARAGDRIGVWLKHLGNGDASGETGAIEAHGKYTSEAIDRVASAIDGLAQAIRDAAARKAE